MNPEYHLDKVYTKSDDVVSRVIEGELIIVPLASNVGDMEDELYSLNQSGQAIWDKLNGVRSLRQIIDELCAEFDVLDSVIETDAAGLVEELLKRNMLVEIK